MKRIHINKPTAAKIQFTLRYSLHHFTFNILGGAPPGPGWYQRCSASLQMIIIFFPAALCWRVSESLPSALKYSKGRCFLLDGVRRRTCVVGPSFRFFSFVPGSGAIVAVRRRSLSCRTETGTRRLRSPPTR